MSKQIGNDQISAGAPRWDEGCRLSPAGTVPAAMMMVRSTIGCRMKPGSFWRIDLALFYG